MKLDDLFARSDRYNVVLNITPEIAEDWLRANTHNRPLSDAHVDYLANEMKAGRWQLTHQGIAFSRNRVLLDGQQRLWAVVLSGVTVPMMVSVNEPPEVMEVLDTGKARTTAHILTLTANMGTITRNITGTLRAMFLRAGSTRRRSPGEERELLVRHLDAVRFANESLASCKFPGVATAVTRGVLARAWHSADPERLWEFAEALRNNRGDNVAGDPVRMLFEYLVKTASGHNRASRLEAYNKTERALSAFLNGERLTRLCAATQELFPLPEESQPTAT